MKATSDPLPETDIGRLVAMLTLMQLREVLPNVQCISKPKGLLRLPFQRQMRLFWPASESRIGSNQRV